VERLHVEGERADRPGAGQRAAIDRAREPSTAGGRLLVCVRCRHPITSEGDRIDIDGLHEHTQINPHGVVWSFGCFARAPGCVPTGGRSHEFTWFAGHAWQIEHCGGCGRHLGWHFTSTARGFHGLIVGRIVTDEEPGGPA